MANELIWKSADELADLYRRGEASPVEVVDAVLDRMEAVNPALNAMVTVTAEQAREDARKATERLTHDKDLPPLFGVPITVKDLTETAGVRTTYGSVAYSDYVPEEDSLAWARMKAQGVILLGKTTTPEFGLLGVTESKLTGSTGTPWDPKRNSGGSSGGAAAAVVSGIGPIAWGSDGGGSIRVPSSLCGATGIKPTIGRIAHMDNDETDSTDGPIARQVLDAALLFDATVGPHPRDRIALPLTGESYAEAARTPGDLTGTRVAACYDLGQTVLDPEVRRVFKESLDHMRSAGAVVEEVAIDLLDTTEYFTHYSGPDYAFYCDEMDAAGEDIWPMVREMAEKGRATTGMQVSAAVHRGKTAIYNAFRTSMESFDVMVTPTTPITAFPHAGDYGPTELVDGQEVPPLAMFLHSMTEPPSHAGLPALSALGGFTDLGLPVGLQFIGHLYADAQVISVAARYERINHWYKQHPNL
ncbi:amidase [Rhodococcoides kroppenstedtii]|uniref:amidase n=1 Tax=Rhodococcoides kroppenstedtii TaxID=293050 RepID=UPI0028EC82EA|nr:amidase [Rhodococcus kroppenstedtii]